MYWDKFNWTSMGKKGDWDKMCERKEHKDGVKWEGRGQCGMRCGAEEC